MAQQVPTASAPHAAVIRSINGYHADRSFAGLAHYDGSEVLADGTEFYIDGGATPTTVATVATALNKAKGVINDHLVRHNGGDGSKWYAHKVTDAARTIATADMDGAALETALFTAAKTLWLEWRTDYIRHINNKKADDTTGIWHGAPAAAPDLVNILGAAPNIVDKYDLAVEMNNGKAQFNAHRIYTTGTTHGAADVTNVVSAANADGDDWDTIKNLMNALKVGLNAHESNAGGVYHNGADGADAQNQVTGADITLPAGLFALAIAIEAAYTPHIADVAKHENADAVNTLAAGTWPPTTFAHLKANTALIISSGNAHIRNAPATSKALRLA